MPSVVLIASPDVLPALKERQHPRDVLAFSDADALRALDAITRQRPRVVMLERQFAATSRGAALVSRIKADPALAGCEIRIVAHEAGAAPGSNGDGVAAAPAPAAVPARAAPLDQRGTRRAPRFKMSSTVEVQIDGNPATIVDLSIVGAQVLSPTILRPNQRVRMQVPNDQKPIRISASVAWASFEMPKGGVRYRAGVEFLDVDPAAIKKFIDANKT